MDLPQLIGNSAQIAGLRTRITRLLVAAARGPRPPAVLLQGETGTGKGLVASLLHRTSSRARAPFVDINCAAIPESLLESELFGYERGAFTDARRSKRGLFQEAHGGTLFLDEVGLLPGPLQAKLLTVLEERAVRRLGATHKEPVDIWIISASNADLAAEVRTRGFREDLFHRLAVVTIEMPPLRGRGEDIVLLAEHFLERTRADYGLPPLGLTPDARERLRTHSWPGNARELANVIERAVLLGDATRITAAALGIGESRVDVPGPAVAEDPERAATRGSRNDVVREHLREVLRASGGNITRTAEILGVSRSTVRAQMRKFGLRIDPETLGERPAPSRASAAPRAAAPTTMPSSAPAPLTAGSVRWERRRITMLRAAFPTPLGEQWSSAGRGLHLVTDKVQGFGGSIEGMSPASLDAAFGVEVIEDAPRRAAHASLAILKAFERIREQDPTLPPPQIAIHSGRALVGYVGDTACLAQDSRLALTATLNSLVDVANPGEVVVSASTAASLERRFALEARAASEPPATRAYRLCGYEQSGLGLWGTPSRFVGRSQEMESLRSHAGAALAGRGRAVGLVGGPGVGKSRLIWEFIRGRSSLAWHVLEGSCAGGERTLYHLAAALLRAFFAVDFDAAAASTRTAIAQALALDERRDASLPALLTILGLPSGDLAWERLDPTERRRRMLESVKHLLVAASRRRPLLVVVEDAHSIDAESQAVVETLVSGMADERMLLLISCRPEYQPPWTGRPSYSELRVDPLSMESAHELLASLLGPNEGFAPLKAALVDRTEGHPFFLEESVRALVEAGTLAGERGDYRLARPITRLEVPPTVEEVLATRIDRLLPDDRRLLQTAAVIGPHVSLPVLRAVANADDETLGASLRRLQDADLLYERSGSGTELSFRHALIHEVAELSLLPGIRRALHGQVLGALEQLHRDASEDHLDRLADHAREGAVWDKALVYAREAGDRALRAAVTPKAVEYYEQALAALRHAPEGSSKSAGEIDLRLRLRDALWPLGRVPEVFAHLSDAETLATAAGDSWGLGWISCYLCQYFWAVGENDRALEVGARALALARSLPDLALEAETSFYVGIAHHGHGDFRQAADVLAASVSALDRAVTTDTDRFPSRRFALNGRAIVRGFLARALAELGRFEEGEVWGHEGVHIAEAVASPFALVAATAGLGTVYIRREEFARALGPLERGLDLCRTYSLHNWFPHVAASLGYTYVGLGRVDDGVDLIQRAIGDAAQTGIRATSSIGFVYLGSAYLRSGDQIKAAEAAQHALETGRTHHAQGVQAWALWLMGEVEASASRVDSAERAYAEALVRASALGMRPMKRRSHLAHARLGGHGAQHHAERAADLDRELAMTRSIEADPA